MRTIRVLTGRHIVCQHLLNVCKFREGPTRLQNYVKGASLIFYYPRSTTDECVQELCSRQSRIRSQR